MGETAQTALEPLEGIPSETVQLCVNEKMEAGKIAVQLRAMFTLAAMDDTHEIYYYQNGVYNRNAEAVLAKTIEEAYDGLGLDEQPTKHFISEVLGHLERGTYINRKEFDNNPRLLNLKNGLFDLETLDFLPHDPKVLSLVQLPVSYDKDAKCGKFEKFLSEILYAEDMKIVQEFFGYSLWKDYLIHKAFMGIGDGANGKSTLLSVLAALLGADNVANRSLQDIQNKRFATSDLYGKMANIYADLPDAALKATGTFKMLTGRDTISAEYKFKNSFQFINYAKLIFSCNRIPRVLDDDSSAFFRRWILVTFPNVFQGDKENKNKLAELTTPEELSGILNWSIEGLIRLHTQEWTFSYSKSTEQVREEYVRKSDPIAAFVMDCLTENANARISKADLYGKFCEYCNLNRLPAVTKDAFFKNLPRHIPYSEARTNTAGERVKVCVGIELRPSTDWGKDEVEGGQQKL